MQIAEWAFANYSLVNFISWVIDSQIDKDFFYAWVFWASDSKTLMLSRRGLDLQILSLLRLWHPFGSARRMCYCRFVSRANPVKSQGPTHFSLTSLDLFFFLFNDCWVYSRFGHYNSIIFTCYRNTRSPGHWTASPVPTDPKLVSFHKIAKCQTFFICKTFWLVESIESDWGRQLLRGLGQVK